MSLLLANGHRGAKYYTLGMIEVEAAIVAKRIQQESVMRAALTRLAISSIPNQSVKSESTKKAAKAFDELMKGTE